MSHYFRRMFASLFLILAVGALAAGGDHCPYCNLEVLSDSKAVLISGEKKTGFRCVLCAVASAKSNIKGDLTIVAPSDTKGQPAMISRKDGKWTVAPEDTLFVYNEGDHAQCQVRYRAVRGKSGFDAFVRANGSVLKGAKALSLKQLVDQAE